MVLPPAAEDDRHGEVDNTKTANGPPDSKPSDEVISLAQTAAAVNVYETDLDLRGKELQWQRRLWENGKQPFGIFPARQIESRLREQWTEARNDRREARRERAKARAVCCLFPGQGAAASVGPLFGAWQMEDR